MVECPRCGKYMSGLKSECSICGYQPNWEDYYDYDLIDNNFFDKILNYNSYDILDIIRSDKTLKITLSGKLAFCSNCGSAVVPHNRIIDCTCCGHVERIKIDKNKLKQSILEETFFDNYEFWLKVRNENFWYGVGENYQKLKLYDKALWCYDKAIELNELMSDAWFNKAEVHEILHEYDEMLMSYDKVIELGWYSASAWNNKGVYYQNISHQRKAIECFDEAIKIDPYEDLYWENKGDSHYYMGHRFKALECYDKAIELNEIIHKHGLIKLMF